MDGRAAWVGNQWGERSALCGDYQASRAICRGRQLCEPTFVEGWYAVSVELEAQRDSRVEPDGSSTASNVGCVNPRHHEAFALAEFVNDDDLKVGERSVVDVNDHPVVTQRAHGNPFLLGVGRRMHRLHQRGSDNGESR